MNRSRIRHFSMLGIVHIDIVFFVDCSYAWQILEYRECENFISCFTFTRSHQRDSSKVRIVKTEALNTKSLAQTFRNTPKGSPGPV
jgi:hypothetical protein